MKKVVRLSSDRISPPEDLCGGAVAHWLKIVGSLPPEYFRPSDVHLLGVYCTSSYVYQKAFEEFERYGVLIHQENGSMKANPASSVMQQAAAAMAQMSTKLRLNPQARYETKVAANLTEKGSSKAKPWEDAG